MKTDMRAITVRLPADTHAELEREATDNGFKSVSDYIYWAAHQQRGQGNALDRIASLLESIIGKKVE